MAKIVFDIEDELKKRLLDSLDELQMDRKSWLEQCICAFLLRDAVEKIKKEEEAAEAEAQLGSHAMPLFQRTFRLKCCRRLLLKA